MRSERGEGRAGPVGNGVSVCTGTVRRRVVRHGDARNAALIQPHPALEPESQSTASDRTHSDQTVIMQAPARRVAFRVPVLRPTRPVVHARLRGRGTGGTSHHRPAGELHLCGVCRSQKRQADRRAHEAAANVETVERQYGHRWSCPMLESPAWGAIGNRLEEFRPPHG